MTEIACDIEGEHDDCPPFVRLHFLLFAAVSFVVCSAALFALSLLFEQPWFVRAVVSRGTDLPLPMCASACSHFFRDGWCWARAVIATAPPPHTLLFRTGLYAELVAGFGRARSASDTDADTDDGAKTGRDPRARLSVGDRRQELVVNAGGALVLLLFLVLAILFK